MTSVQYWIRLPEESEDEWRQINALNERMAAEEGVRNLNDCYDCLRPNEAMFVLVKHGAAGKERLYNVFAEPEINYYAEKLDKLPCKWCELDCFPVTIGL